MANAPNIPRSPLTIPEFLEWADRDGSAGRWQLRAGVPEAMSPPTFTHGSILGELQRLVSTHLMNVDSPCQSVLTPGVIPRTRSERTMLIADLGVTCAPDQGERALPDPLVLVEILSPSNEVQTRANIAEYRTIPSVRDILLIGSTQVRAERWFRRSAEDVWLTELPVTGDGLLRIDSIGFSVPLSVIYRRSMLSANT